MSRRLTKPKPRAGLPLAPSPATVYGRPPPKSQWETPGQRNTTPTPLSQLHASKLGPGATSTYQAPGPPVDPALEAQKAAANLSIGLGDAFDTYKTGRVTTNFGNLDDPSADTLSNPYSRAALLQQSYLNAKRGSVNSYAAQGQLYSGALQNRTEADLKGYNQGLDAAKQERQDILDELLRGKLTRYSQTGAQVNSDTLASIIRALGG